MTFLPLNNERRTDTDKPTKRPTDQPTDGYEGSEGSWTSNEYEIHIEKNVRGYIYNFFQFSPLFDFNLLSTSSNFLSSPPLVVRSLEVKLPYEPVCPSVCRIVCHNFLKGRKVSLPCSFRSTCFSSVFLLVWLFKSSLT